MLQTNPAASLHCVGHSLGAHTCGFAGKSLAKLGLGLQRISALDPAGPLFLKTFFRGGVNTEDDAAARLTASDADFVSAIHTDAMFYGSRVAVGHVDMYPGHAGRWGTGQSGYKKYFQRLACIISECVTYFRFDLVDDVVGGSHNMAITLYAASVNNRWSTVCSA